MSRRRRAPWTVLLAAAAVLASTAATDQTALLIRAGPVLQLPLPPLPGVPLPVLPGPLRPGSVPPLPVPPLPVPPLPVPPLPVPPLPVAPSPGSGPAVPLLPGVRPPPRLLPPLGGRVLAAGGALPIAGGPTDTRPGPGPSFTLEARSITLTGARLRGLTTPPGRRTPAREPVVRIDVDAATLTAPTIRALHARRGVVEARSDQVARLAGRGQIYVEEITGTLTVAGLPTVRIRLSPRELTTPGIDLGFLALPSLTLTDVTARVAFLQAGRLTIPAATFVASTPPT